MKKHLYCTFIVVLICQFGNAQIAPEETVEKENKTKIYNHPTLKGMLLGIHGARETMFEIGYFYYDWTEITTGKIPAIGGTGYSISTEHYINDNYIIAPKAAIWGNLWYINVGISTPWYFDMEKNNSLRVRPEIGIGSGSWKLTFAANMAITNKDMSNVSKYMVSAICFLNFNKKAKDVKQKIGFLGM